MSSESLEFRTDDGKPYRVLLMCRSSGRLNDGSETPDDGRLDEQEARLREWISRNITGLVEVTAIKLVEEGKSHDSVHEQSLHALQTGGYDLILVASLDRIARGLDLLEFLKLAARRRTRVIAAADSALTENGDWPLSAALASPAHRTVAAQMACRARRSRRRRDERHH